VVGAASERGRSARRTSGSLPLNFARPIDEWAFPVLNTVNTAKPKGPASARKWQEWTASQSG